MYLERFRDANRFRFLPRASVFVRKAAIRYPSSWVFSEKGLAFRGDAGADGGFWGLSSGGRDNLREQKEGPDVESGPFGLRGKVWA